MRVCEIIPIKYSLASVYQTQFFKPISLKNTYYSDVVYSKRIYKQIAHVYPNGKSKWIASTAFNPGLWGAAGGMIMDSDDLITWLHALFTPGIILSQKSLREMQQTNSIGYAPPKPMSARFGLGVYSWQIKSLGTIWWYTGIIGGYTSTFVWIPSKQQIISTSGLLAC